MTTATSETISLSERELRPDELVRGQADAFERDMARLRARRSEFVHVCCPACSADDGEPAMEAWTFQYVRCRECQTVYLNPRPSEQVMADCYADSEDYRFFASRIFPASEGARRQKIHLPRLQRLWDACTRSGLKPRTLIEIGAGFGTFSALARDSGYFQRVVAIEPTPELAQACCERGLEVVPKRIEEIGQEIGTVEVAASFEVIEHLFDPRQFVRQCARLLCPGGLLVLSCPNVEGFDIAMLGAKSSAIQPGHVNMFNPRSLRGLVESCGFSIVEMSTPGLLDAELVRKAALAGQIDLSGDPFLSRVLLDDWDRLGAPFQDFLAAQGLSSHLWMVARRSAS